ncbi:MAG: hypothetical protein GY898_05290, partial [Proteobacteria bacterium]|nr:hypothetical protein [Pseudomonadota bacterium]
MRLPAALAALATAASLSACLGAGYQIAGSRQRAAIAPLAHVPDGDVGLPPRRARATGPQDARRVAQLEAATARTAVRQARARPRPFLRVDRADVLARRTWTGVVSLHGPAGVPGSRRLTVRLDRGPAVTIDYHLPIDET